MDEQMRFIIRHKDGESMASLCREFGISRKTGYKILGQYEECGLEGLNDRARRPIRYTNQLPEQLEAATHRRRPRHRSQGMVGRYRRHLGSRNQRQEHRYIRSGPS